MSPSKQSQKNTQQLIQPDQKKKAQRKAIPTRLRGRVWESHMPSAYKKMNEGPCYVCQETISILHFECGHIIAHSQGGTSTVENLVPVCSSCNKSMGSKNLLDFKAEYYAGKVSVPQDTYMPLTRVKSYNFPAIDMFSGTLPIIISQWTSFGGSSPVEPVDKGSKANPSGSQTKHELKPLATKSSHKKSSKKSTTVGCDFLLVKGQRKGEKCGHTITSKTKKVNRCKKHQPCKQSSCMNACLHDKDYCLQHSCKRKITTKQGESKCGCYCDNQLRLCSTHASK